MTSRDLAALRAKLEPPWDDLREQRVLVALLEKRRRSILPRQRAWVWALVPAAAVLALVVWGVRAWHRTPTVATNAAVPGGQSTIALADGSTAILATEATVQIEEQRADRVHLVQSRGSVRYEVRPDTAREFVVSAADATIRVRGTVFTVNMHDGAVEVGVERGRVEVSHGGTTHDLVVGESLRVQTGAPAPDLAPSTSLAPPGAASSSTARPPVSTTVAPEPPSAATLEAQADAARIAGDNGQAAAALERLVAVHPRDPRVPSALFTLGRVERARSMVGASARAFERCFLAAPSGPLAQDALAEAAQSWSSAGNDDAARQAAGKYLARWPHGPAAVQMRAIASR
jgi:transmembrane sensor